MFLMDPISQIFQFGAILGTQIDTLSLKPIFAVFSQFWALSILSTLENIWFSIFFIKKIMFLTDHISEIFQFGAILGTQIDTLSLKPISAKMRYFKKIHKNLQDMLNFFL